MILDLGDQSVEITHNIEKHISNLVNATFDDGYEHIVPIAI